MVPSRLPPNMRLKLPGAIVLMEAECLRWRAQAMVQRQGALQASRPQLNRDPLGGTRDKA